jgi:hypothetical protein
LVSVSLLMTRIFSYDEPCLLFLWVTRKYTSSSDMEGLRSIVLPPHRLYQTYLSASFLIFSYESRRQLDLNDTEEKAIRRVDIIQVLTHVL